MPFLQIIVKRFAKKNDALQEKQSPVPIDKDKSKDKDQDKHNKSKCHREVILIPKERGVKE